MVKVVGYARVSSKSQATNTSLPEQERQIREYCHSQGLELIGMFSDVGSGKTTNRPGYNAMLSILSQDDCIGVVGAKIDRLGRNAVDLLTLGDKLSSAGKQIFIPGININLTSSAGKMIFRTLSVMAEFDVDVVNERFESGRKVIRRNGGNLGGQPKFGEKASDKKRESYVVNEDEQKIIELIKRHRRSGKSQNAIAKWLNANGYTTRHGKKWTNVQIGNILKQTKKTA